MSFYCTLLGFLLAASASPVAAQAALDCNPLLGREQGREAPLLRRAPHGGSRPTPHRLLVRWSKGVREFVDRAPFMEGAEEGTRHLYCGYDPSVGMHLIYRIDEESSYGLLLVDATGELLPAGERVLFTEDKTRYLAEIQPGGLDGEEWRIYSKSGHQVWKGFSCAHTSKNSCTTLETPRWNDSGKLQADAVCGPAHVRTPVTLRLLNKRWSWTPVITCQR